MHPLKILFQYENYSIHLNDGYYLMNTDILYICRYIMTNNTLQ